MNFFNRCSGHGIEREIRVGKHMDNTRIQRHRIWLAFAAIVACMIAATCCASIWRGMPTAVYAMDTSSALTVGELLSNHYENRTDGKAFDRRALDDLLAALGGADASLETVSGLGNRDASYFYGQNGDRDIVLTFGGYQWTVTYLTQDRESGNVVVSLWMTSAPTQSVWNEWSSETYSDAFPSNMYGTSLIRSKEFNSGSGYAASAADAAQGTARLTPCPQSAEHRYAPFTMSPDTEIGKASLTEYLVRPRKIAYQESECMHVFASSWSTAPNEAYGTPSYESYYYESMDYSDKPQYNDWADDYLWLPSLAETGYGGYYGGVAGIWNLSLNQRSNNEVIWSRTGGYSVPYGACYIDTGGSFGGNSVSVTTTYGVRPALHLDLTKAVAAATDPLDAPTWGQDASIPYNGQLQTIVPGQFDATNMQATAVGVDADGNPIAAADIAVDETTGTVRASRVGTYTITVTMRDPSRWHWTDKTGGNGARTLQFRITPKALEATWTNTLDKWEWRYGQQQTATLTVSGIVSGDSVSLTASYATAGAVKQEIAAEQKGTQTIAQMDLSRAAVGAHTLTAALDPIAADNDNGNYTLARGDVTKAFTVLAQGVDPSQVGWTYTAFGPSGNPIPDGADHTQIADGQKLAYALFGTRQSFGAVRYRLEIDPSTLPKDGSGNAIAAVDEQTQEYNGTTYSGGYSVREGDRVGTYTTKVLLKILGDAYLFPNNAKSYELSLRWEIGKGTFDLSGVQWKYKYTTDSGTVSDVYAPAVTELEYNDGKVIRVEIDPTTMPLGLNAPGGIFDYQNASGIQVKKYKATVAVDTMEYDDACFEPPADLVLNWEILGKGIVVKWKSVPSGTYYLKELNCDPKYTTGESKIVHYKYFAPDGSLLGIDEAGRQALADKVIADGIGPENPQTFTIQAYLDGNNSGNYRLLTDPARTTVSIGNDPFTAVQAQVPATITYDGNARYTHDDLRFTGASIGANDYTIAYYAGTDVDDLSKNDRLDGAPTDAGKYVIAIAMLDDSYQLEQGVFAVEILPKRVAVPTVRTATFNGTAYNVVDLLTGYDAQIMTLDGESVATNAGTYRATVALTDGNYAWESDGDARAAEQPLVWTIAKAQIRESWSNAGGKPTFVIPTEYASYVQVTYAYADMYGNVVAESDLVSGQQYKIVAKLSGAGVDNFEITDGAGNVLQLPTQSSSAPFTYVDPDGSDAPPQSDGQTTGGLHPETERLFVRWMYAVAGMMGAMTLLLLGIWITVCGIRNLRRRGDRR